jgi:hypothetical protein
MVEDATKVGKLFAHRIENEDKFCEGDLEFSPSSAIKELVLPSAIVRSLIVEGMWIGNLNGGSGSIREDFE